jgi:putative addiction module component (TIGR02574 family)
MIKDNHKNPTPDYDDDGESWLTDEQFAELERRVKAVESGEMKMYTWEEVKARIRKNHQRSKRSKPK